MYLLQICCKSDNIDNTKLLQQLKARFKSSVNCNEYKVKHNNEINNEGRLNIMVGAMALRINGFFVLVFPKSKFQNLMKKGYYLYKNRQYLHMLKGKVTNYTSSKNLFNPSIKDLHTLTNLEMQKYYHN